MTEDIKKVIGIIDGFLNTANVIKEESQDVITKGLCESKIRILNQLKDKITNIFSLTSSNCIDDLEKEIPEVDRFITITEYPHLKEIFKDLFGVKEEKECV